MQTLPPPPPHLEFVAVESNIINWDGFVCTCKTKPIRKSSEVQRHLCFVETNSSNAILETIAVKGDNLYVKYSFNSHSLSRLSN